MQNDKWQLLNSPKQHQPINSEHIGKQENYTWLPISKSQGDFKGYENCWACKWLWMPIYFYMSIWLPWLCSYKTTLQLKIEFFKMLPSQNVLWPIWHIKWQWPATQMRLSASLRDLHSIWLLLLCLLLLGYGCLFIRKVSGLYLLFDIRKR